nr:replicative DNA helicase [bacterium]
METGRIPPHNLEAEQSVLGSMMLDVESVSLATTQLEADDFYAPANRVIFDVMLKLYATGKPVDLVTVCDELYRRGAMEGVGGVGYVTALSRQVPSTSNVASYIEIVHDRSMLRRLIRAGADLQQDGYEGQKTSDAILQDAEKRLYDIAVNRDTNTLAQIQPAMYTVYDRIAQQYENRGQLSGINTGFTDLNYKLSGFNPSDLILIAARPAMGKTSLMLNFVLAAALGEGLPVAFFSLEMAREQLVNRMLGTVSGVNLTRMRSGELEDEDWGLLMEAMGRLGPAPIYIDDTPSITPADMLSKCRKLKLQHGLGLVLIDYLQL